MQLADGYKQTEVGVIPVDWDISTIEKAFAIDNHLRLPLSRDVRKEMQGKYPYYGPTRIQDHINEYRVEGTYALIGEDGDHFLKWEDQSMTLLAHGKFNVNNHAHLIRGHENLTEWFFFFFQHRDLTPFLTRQGAGRFKLSKASLVAIPISLPPLAEQRAIAEALSDVDSLIASLDALITKKRQIKQGTMQQLLTGKKRLPEFSGEWEETTLGELGQFFSGGTPSTRVDHYYDGGTIPWITSSDCNVGRIQSVKGRITQAGLDNSAAKMIRKGSLLVALYGATAGVVATSEIDAAINQAVLAGELVHADSNFVFYQLAMLKDWIISTYTQGGQPNLSGHIVKSIELKLPKRDEQVAIAEVLSDMAAEITALEQKRDKTRLIKQGMMQELLTGKTRLEGIA